MLGGVPLIPVLERQTETRGLMADQCRLSRYGDVAEEQRVIKDTLQTNEPGRVMHRHQSLRHTWQTF